MEMSQGNSLNSYLKPTKMSFKKKMKDRKIKQVLSSRRWRGEHKERV
jgi:hypothetical protein